MRKLLIAIVIGVIAWQSWGAYQTRQGDEEPFDDGESSEIAQLLDQEAASDTRSPYQCDGRVHCSQMTSCEEAEFFLANCPGVKMDGGGDGVPCEKQWCGDR
jgi:Excalibur calcium-binding domain